MRAKTQTTGQGARASDARSSRRAPWLRTRLSARPSGASSARARRAALPPPRPCARRSFPRGAARPGARAASWRWTDLARAGWAATTAPWTRTCFTSACARSRRRRRARTAPSSRRPSRRTRPSSPGSGGTPRNDPRPNVRATNERVRCAPRKRATRRRSHSASRVVHLGLTKKNSLSSFPKNKKNSRRV